MIEVLVGMIASGKSTYARERADAGALVVCHDDLTEMLHAEYRYEPGLREAYRAMEERIAGVALSYGRDIVVDRTHLTQESRKRWLDWARSHHVDKVVAVVFPVESPGVHASRRFVADHRGRMLEEWRRVAEHHYEQWQAEPIGNYEGFNEIRRRSI